MLNFYVVPAGHDKVTDAGRPPRAGANSKPHYYEQKVQKMKDFPKTWILTGKQFEDFRQKDASSLKQTTTWNIWPLNTKIKYGSGKQ